MIDTFFFFTLRTKPEILRSEFYFLLEKYVAMYTYKNFSMSTKEKDKPPMDFKPSSKIHILKIIFKTLVSIKVI